MKNRDENDILSSLYQVVLDRRNNPRPDSYVAALLKKGPEAIHAKISEETGELIEASRRSSPDEIIHEMADLWFHTVVLLGTSEIEPAAVYRELELRWGRSGLQEKAARGKPE